MRGLLLSALAVVMAGCLDGNFAPNAGGDGGGNGQAEALARQEFSTSVAGAMSQCSACHAGAGLPPAPIFGATYDELTAYNNHALLSCDSPELSLLITKGLHSPGVAFTADVLPAVTNWVTGTWAAAVCGGGPIAGEALTGSFIPQLDAENSIDLGGLAPGLTGTRITFMASAVTGGIYLSSMKIIAGTAGAVVKAPLFSSCITGASSSDQGDSFSNVDLTVPSGQTATLGRGTMSFVGWETGNGMAVSFQKIEPIGGSQGAYTPGAGACAAPL